MSDSIASLTHFVPSVVFTEWVVGGLDIPCEYKSHPSSVGGGCDQPAEWVMWKKPCCTDGLKPGLACTGCKDARLMNTISVECLGCGHLYIDAADAYALIEPINKKGAK